MKRFSVTLSLILGVLLTVSLTGLSQVHPTVVLAQGAASVSQSIEDRADNTRTLQFGRKPPEALEETLSNIKKQMKQLQESIDQVLSQSDLDPVKRKALLMARSLVKKMIELLDSVSRLLKDETGPESKKICVEPL